MNARRACAFALAAVALSATSAAPLAAQRGDPCAHDAVCRFLDRNIGIKQPVTLERLRKFAKLEGYSRVSVSNAHDRSETDTIHTLAFTGLYVSVYVPVHGPALLKEIVVWDARYPLPLELVFGKSTFDDVQHALGLPKAIQHAQDGSSRWQYDNVEGTASIIFRFAPEPSMRITRVEWRFKAD